MSQSAAYAPSASGAGVGLAWDANSNHWANPALLAFRPGIQYLDFSSNPAEGLADDILLTSKELTLGAYGVTLLFGTGPVDGVYLDGGEQQATDEYGNPAGTIHTYMKSEHWGIGVDFVQLAEIIMGKGAFSGAECIGQPAQRKSLRSTTSQELIRTSTARASPSGAHSRDWTQSACLPTNNRGGSPFSGCDQIFPIPFSNWT